MTNPPDWIVDLAVEAAMQSPCLSRRGAVIWLEGRGGVWHAASGHNHKPCFARQCTSNDACKLTCRSEAVHAEEHAIIDALKNRYNVLGANMLHVKVKNGAIVPSGQPSCLECAKLIVASGIEFMWLFHEEGWQRYRSEEFYLMSIDGERRRCAT